MMEYIEMLLEDMAQIQQEATGFHDRARALPCGEEQDNLTRQWALARGEVRGLEIALTRFAEYLQGSLETLEARY